VLASLPERTRELARASERLRRAKIACAVTGAACGTLAVALASSGVGWVLAVAGLVAVSVGTRSIRVARQEVAGAVAALRPVYELGSRLEDHGAVEGRNELAEQLGEARGELKTAERDV